MEHNNEKNITCPYCDWEDRDSWEFDEDDGIVTCGNCEKEFNVSRMVEVFYSSSKISCADGSHSYELDHYFESTKKHIKGTEWKELPESEWKYYKINVCSVCDDKQFEKILKENYLAHTNKINI